MIFDLILVPLKIIFAGLVSLFPSPDPNINNAIVNFLTQMTAMTDGLNQLIPIDSIFMVLKFVILTEFLLFSLRIIAKLVKFFSFGAIDMVHLIPGGRILDATSDK